MYLGKDNRFLSEALLMTVIFGIVADLCTTFVRLYEGSRGVSPDMFNSGLWSMQNIISVVQIIFTAVVFVHSCHRISRMLSFISPEDRKQMGLLQEEAMGDSLPCLEAGDIHKLLEIWGMILVGVQVGYLASSIIYRRFMLRLSEALDAGYVGSETFVTLYNDTHGFKYMGMLLALLLGIAITGIFLNDRYLKLFSIIYAALFIAAFAVMNMDSFEIMGRTVGVVWTSILYHAIELAGMILLVMYLRKRYPGV